MEEKLALVPAYALVAAGRLETTGAGTVLTTVTVTLTLVVEPLALVTMTLYWPASPAWAELIFR